MNPVFLRYYSQELQHVREMGGEFAADYPKIAGRLGLDSFECADPYVERLLEGFSFLTARVQMKIDAEYPRFTQHLSELVYPHLLAPTPSMAVVQLQADLDDPALARGFLVPRGSAMRSVLGKGDTTACEYRSAHDVTLWPIELVEAKLLPHTGARAAADIALPPTVKAALRLRLRTRGGIAFGDLALDRLCLHLRGADGLPARIYERLLASVQGVLVTPAAKSATHPVATSVATSVAPPATTPAAWHRLLPKSALQPLGFDEQAALLPAGPRSFPGYRLLQEYFAFAQRYLFIELGGLGAALAGRPDQEIEITVLLGRTDPELEQALDASHFALNCTPVINLFQRRADRIEITDEQSEYHVLVDRTRPMDHEVFQIESVTGYGSGQQSQQTFRPFYTANDLGGPRQERAFYQIRRERRTVSQRQRRDGPRSSYIGSEAYLSIVDAAAAPYSSALRQLGLSLWCTNRDLPLSMPLGVGKTDFVLEAGGPLAAVRCVAGPSRPLPSFAEGAVAWRLLNQLSLNYLSLFDSDPQQGAAALREMLALYCHADDAAAQRQIEGVRTIGASAVTRRMPSPGPIAFGRGVEITVTLDDAAFDGTGAFLLGAVLAHFFGMYAPINSFTETVIKTLARGEIMRWPAKEGSCAIR
ncbi:MAG: type VI secretion system baseplate subunit TssF [Pseudomonadota bacterium]